VRALLLGAVLLFAPAPLVPGVVYAGRVLRRALTPLVLMVRVHVPVLVEGPVRALLPQAPPSRGDVVGIHGTTMSAQVVCVADGLAWCRSGRPQLSGMRIIDPADTPTPVALTRLDVLERGVPVFGPVN